MCNLFTCYVYNTKYHNSNTIKMIKTKMFTTSARIWQRVYIREMYKVVHFKQLWSKTFGVSPNYNIGYSTTEMWKMSCILGSLWIKRSFANDYTVREAPGSAAHLKLRVCARRPCQPTQSNFIVINDMSYSAPGVKHNIRYHYRYELYTCTVSPLLWITVNLGIVVVSHHWHAILVVTSILEDVVAILRGSFFCERQRRGDITHAVWTKNK